MALVLSLFLYIHWYLEMKDNLGHFVKKYGVSSGELLSSETWVIILTLSILVCIILFGLFTIYVFYQKSGQLYRLQQNFINNFTHELKSPLASIKLFLDTFVKYELPRENQLKYIEFMLKDTDRLDQNVNRILKLAEIESGKKSYEFKTVDLYEFTRNFLKKNAHLFSNCKMNFHSDSSGKFLYKIDETLFESVLINLLSNSVKYNNSEVPQISIDFRKVQRKTIIHFSDNGIGIEKKDAKKVFKKFYQVGKSDDMTAKGSGLGLYMVKCILQLHGGSISIQGTDKGLGTVFTICLDPKKRSRNAKLRET
jgi:two-component system, OmpR family, phosphate regulon sensor histidine kinase PhoR